MRLGMAWFAMYETSDWERSILANGCNKPPGIHEFFETIQLCIPIRPEVVTPWRCSNADSTGALSQVPIWPAPHRRTSTLLTYVPNSFLPFWVFKRVSKSSDTKPELPMRSLITVHPGYDSQLLWPLIHPKERVGEGGRVGLIV